MSLCPLLLMLFPSIGSTENCAYPLASLPDEVPSLPENTCATSPNLPALGQPILQNYEIPLAGGLSFAALYQKALAEKGWSVGETKTKKTTHGEMSYFDATHPHQLTVRIMVHGHGMHHSGITHATIAVQQTVPGPVAPSTSQKQS